MNSTDITSKSWNKLEENRNLNNTLEQTNNGNALIFQNNNREKNAPTFGAVSVNNASNIHFGNKTFYQGPVTIHLVNGDKEKIRSRTLVKKKPIENDLNLKENGIENLGFEEIDLGNSHEKINEINSDKDDCWKKLPISKHTIFRIVLLLSIVIAISITTILVLNSKTNAINPVKNISHTLYDEQDQEGPIDGPIDPVGSLKPLKLKLVTRLQWLAQPPNAGVNPLKTPVPLVIIAHTATQNCSSQAQCKFQVRNIQTYHMESMNFSDIGYNFLVGGDGEVYVGRGWQKEGAHTYGYNSQSIGIAFIGTFIRAKPPNYQLIACKKLIAKGVEQGYIQKNYKLLGARQCQTTQSPGDALFEEITHWEQWAAKGPP